MTESVSILVHGTSTDTIHDSLDVLHEGSLHFCTSRGNLAQLSAMLDKYNPDINDADYDGRTCLHIASSLGFVDIVSYLIQKGANVNAHDRFGGTPRDDAIRNGHDNITKILLENGATQPAEAFELDLITSCSKGDAARVRRLLKNQINPNCCDYDGRSPLHLAVASKNLDIVEILLQFNANPLVKDRFGGTPLSDAARNKSRVGQDKILDLLRKVTLTDENENSSVKVMSDSFVLFLGLFEILMIILYAVFGSYKFHHSSDPADLESQVIDRNRYPYFQDVHVMIFVGFGFLMTFLRKFGYSSLGLTFLISVLAIQLHPLLFTIWQTLFDNFAFVIQMDISALVTSDFAAGAILISFGALLGKTSPLQMLIISVFESVFYSLNEKLVFVFKISDIGGSMVIHTFGAFFGLGCSKALENIKSQSHPDNTAVYHSDMFAMIGTLFLWMFWPSFNAALTATPDGFERAVINTVLSLTASCASAFLFSYILRNEKKFIMVDIQNATLAGGVAIGSSADLPIGPGFALLIGALSGIISVLGYTKLQSWLERSLGIYDTCGIANLHGIPGILGGLASVFAALSLNHSLFLESIDHLIAESIVDRSSKLQAAYQLAFLISTVSISSISGYFCGWIVKRVRPLGLYFQDGETWEVPEMEVPYYFDARGEVEHKPIRVEDRKNI